MSILFTADDDLDLKRSDFVKIAQELPEHELFVKHLVFQSK